MTIFVEKSFWSLYANLTQTYAIKEIFNMEISQNVNKCHEYHFGTFHDICIAIVKIIFQQLKLKTSII